MEKRPSGIVLTKFQLSPTITDSIYTPSEYLYTNVMYVRTFYLLFVSCALKNTETFGNDCYHKGITIVKKQNIEANIKLLPISFIVISHNIWTRAVGTFDPAEGCLRVSSRDCMLGRHYSGIKIY